MLITGSDDKETGQLQVGETPSRRSPAPRYARLGKRPVSPYVDDDENDRLTLLRRAVPTNFRFAGLGKRRVSLAYKAAGLGKRDDDWAYETGVGRPEAEIDQYGDPVFEEGPEAAKRRVSTAMRYAGLGKRQQRRVDAGMRYMGLERRHQS